MKPPIREPGPYRRERGARERMQRAAARREEFAGLIAASLVVLSGLLLAYFAKTSASSQTGNQTAQQPIVNLNRLNSSIELSPYFKDMPDAGERAYVSDRIFAAVRAHEAENVGVIARLRVSKSDVLEHRGLKSFSEKIDNAIAERAKAQSERLARMSWLGRKFRDFRAWLMPPPERDPSVPLLTQQQFHNLKPWFTVRSVGQFQMQFILWVLLYFAAFYALHLFWRWKGFAGDNLILPIVHTLTGIGLILMVTLRDPLRDTLTFTDFATGVCAGIIAMALATQVDFDAAVSKFSFIFLAAAILLGLALAIFGTGPGQSDAKVNLLHFQPIEVIRILLVFFLAGYFAEHWDLLRDLRETRALPSKLLTRFRVPRLEYVLPVAIGVSVSLVLFFFLKDLGPALVIGCVFLLLFAIARQHLLGATAGFVLIVLGFAAGHAIGYPETVEQRVEIWRQPWRNTVHGGDQIAHSIWALSSGGWQGSGIGMGSPAVLPAGHTDLVLAVAGEELGFGGLLSILALYAFLAFRSFRIALNAPTDYSFFLVTGLTLVILLQLFLIAAGLLNVIPLSGVVSPFLSYGKTSMVANFVAFGIILAVSARVKPEKQKRTFGLPMRLVAVAAGLFICVLIGRAAYIQVMHADEFALRDAEVRYADGSIGLEYNPRLIEIARRLPKGDIFDRNGVPLATSDMALVEQHRNDYARLGIAVDGTVSNTEPRHYPLGPQFFYLVGDVRTTLKQGAGNVLFQEKLSRVRLQGYDDRRELVALEDPWTGQATRVFRYDYRDLLPLLRHAYNPNDPGVRDLRARERNVHMTVDARFQLRASAILKKEMDKLGTKGALVVLQPDTGDLLAAVSYPWPEAEQFAAFRADPDRSMERDLFDRARFGLYPPGSSFKIVTAIAALRYNPALVHQSYKCILLDHGRVGNYIGSSKRPVRDDVQDRTPHGTLEMARAITVSCNAYFAQLGTYNVGARNLLDTAAIFGINVAHPNTPAQLKQSLPQAAYGQGQVVTTPFDMARVAAAVASGGNIPQGRWVLDESNNRTDAPVPVLAQGLANQIGAFMRSVVASPAGTGKVLSGSSIPIAGKTGTAELNSGPSHAWFIGFAPYGSSGKKIAFAIVVEHGQYGGKTAAPIAGELVAAARELGLL